MVGGGILAYYVDKKGKNHFLLQQTYSGRKVGHLIDLGGQVNENESQEDGAIREFFEEGGKLVFKLEEIKKYFDISQTFNKEFYAERNKKEWKLYFVRFPKFDLAPLNNFKPPEGSKKREFFWISEKKLLEAWKRKKEEKKKQKHKKSKEEKDKDHKKKEKDEENLDLVTPGVPPKLVWNRLSQMPLKKKLKMLNKHSLSSPEFEDK
eukprot:TRINITY_DN3332_c0_g1_i1.p1 TRINITY_DN3332_c0_g1~~TRINITY_DN3332_c0_g1_i1.p1  ORF type:complete len:207 (-),score=82.83 TRINITY_DN3332_c0_g1_i1:84-704(-)